MKLQIQSGSFYVQIVLVLLFMQSSPNCRSLHIEALLADLVFDDFELLSIKVRIWSNTDQILISCIQLDPKCVKLLGDPLVSG